MGFNSGFKGLLSCLGICLEGPKKTTKNSVNTAHVRSERILCM